MNIRTGPKPFKKLSGIVMHRHTANQPPAVDPIRASQTAFECVNVDHFSCTLPGIPRSRPVLWMEWLVPPAAKTFLESEARIVHPSSVEINVRAIRSGDPDHLRHGFGQGAEFLPARAKGFRRALVRGDVSKGAKGSVLIVVYNRPALDLHIDHSSIQLD